MNVHFMHHRRMLIIKNEHAKQTVKKEHYNQRDNKYRGIDVGLKLMRLKIGKQRMIIKI